ncbi:MAG: hypothetical protein LBN43_09170 [Oscillospiraceae bacterium]|jgi:REP element-mobilizing transposase RayT|nr:hypothetical protein [Oscillospiraceae bacterium]
MTEHNRRSIRLKGYDYAQNGAYFVTICTQGRQCVFGEVVNGEVRLSYTGVASLQCWNSIPEHFPNVKLDEFVIMPNHIHGIIVVDNADYRRGTACRASTDKGRTRTDAGEQFSRPVKGSLPTIVRSYKSAVSKQLGKSIWQRNYYEHIIRNDEDYLRICEYIQFNPRNWEKDELYIGEHL